VSSQSTAASKRESSPTKTTSLCWSLSIAAAILLTPVFAVLGASDEDPREPVIRTNVISKVSGDQHHLSINLGRLFLVTFL